MIRIDAVGWRGNRWTCARARTRRSAGWSRCWQRAPHHACLFANRHASRLKVCVGYPVLTEAQAAVVTDLR